METANVLGLLPGTSAHLRDEVVLVSAHYDHVGDDPESWVCPEGVSALDHDRDAVCVRVPGKRYPGANDNASGIAVMLEIARLWHEVGYRPQRSVLFAAWGAQEAGQAGLQHYLDHPVVPVGHMVAALHLDSVGGGEGYYLVAQGSRDRDGLLRYTMQAAEDALEGRLTLTSPPARDDPAAALRQMGIPTLWLSWRDASRENWPAEHADAVEPYRLGVTGQMVTLSLMALAQ
jgi:Zn-dependent M28 family amino/carboxypeptidase